MTTIDLTVDGAAVEVPDEGLSLLDVLRGQLGIFSVKDGCSPQGQCGCCTVLVDGAPRVACVTPVRRVRGRTITTLDGFDEAERARWTEAFNHTGASQCGFCTPGIIVRLASMGERKEAPVDRAAVDRALAAHLCRCTGWQPIRDAYSLVAAETPVTIGRDGAAMQRRATIEGRNPQRVGPEVAAGLGGFADDIAPPGALVAIPDGDGGWVTGETLAGARIAAGKIQGRRTTLDPVPPIAVADGQWIRTLQTGWIEPGYLETDASWAEPDGVPASPLANGGAFGAKVDSVVSQAAKRLADEYKRPVRVLLSREDTVRMGSKRPPLSAGIAVDGSLGIRVARTEGIVDAIRSGLGDMADRADIVEVDVVGPRTSTAARAAGWAEGVVIRAAVLGHTEPVTTADGAKAEVEVLNDRIKVTIECGEVLDATVLRSYCTGAVHMALGWVTSESITVDESGEVNDLTIRSFGILGASDMPEVEIEIIESATEPVNGSDAVFAATAAAVWASKDFPSVWPTG